jgi:hypothetical protein
MANYLSTKAVSSELDFVSIFVALSRLFFFFFFFFPFRLAHKKKPIWYVPQGTVSSGTTFHNYL